MKHMIWCAALALAACGSADGNGSANDAARQPAANASAMAPAVAVKADLPELVLEGDGLVLTGAVDGVGRPVRFGTPMAETMAALAEALGTPPAERGTNEECGGGGMDFARWEGQLTAWFQDGRFAGWDSKGKLRTAASIGIGSRRGDLARLQQLRVEESTLGTEFEADGIGGILESKAQDASVTNLWGGSTCMFR